MERRVARFNLILILLGFTVLFGILLFCARGLDLATSTLWATSEGVLPTAQVVPAKPTRDWGLPTRRPPGAPLLTPTPDSPHALPSVRKNPEQYAVQAGDTMGQIATRFGISIEQLAQANQVLDANVLSIGQVLLIPAPTPQGVGPSFKVIPDSELVYGPANIGFQLEELVQKFGGYLANYREDVDGKSLNGVQIVQDVAQTYSVNPRLLVAILQHQSAWLTNPAPDSASREYPMGFPDPARKGLYRQLAWAANVLNRGFYLWRVNGAAVWNLSDGGLIPISPTINAGTAGVQHLFALLYERPNWEKAVSEQGLFATYNTLFGYPFDYAIEPSMPLTLTQPSMQLPFEAGAEWAFTSGPHAAWADGTAWAALDFAPPGEAPGCVLSNAWVVAVADGLILRSENGVVIQDLDGDGLEQSGWVMLYMHVETRDRVMPGVYLKAGERIGHPSCEGGISTGTHLHLARRYNGEWIPADQNTPFVLDGWVSSGIGVEYDGYMQRAGQKIEAYAGYSPENAIQR